MSSFGSGRGRGWLNLEQKNEPPKPGSNIPYNKSFSKDEMISREFPELINTLQQLDLKDDGILFNQKVKHLLEIWKNECSTKELVKASFDSLYKASLKDVGLASKLVLLIASRTFLSQEIVEENIRKLFLEKLQTNFENANELQHTNPELFRNFVHIMGEFYNKTGVVNGKSYVFLSIPIITCLKMLLNGDNLDLMLLAKQLYLNGPALNEIETESFLQLMFNIRETLITKPNISQEQKAWLMLSLDLYHYTFNSVPTHVLKFYEKFIGIEPIQFFQNKNILINKWYTKCSDKIQQSENTSTTQNTLSNSEHQMELKNNMVGGKVGGGERNRQSADVKKNYSNNVSEYSSNMKLRDEYLQKKEKSGRPILGTGARKNQPKPVAAPTAAEEEVWQDVQENWNNDKQKISGTAAWNVQERNTGKVKYNKGWEHDDRFDNDYS